MHIALLDRLNRQIQGIGPTKEFALADAESWGLEDLPKSVASVESTYHDPEYRFAFIRLTAEEVSAVEKNPGTAFDSLNAPERRLPPSPAVLCPVLVNAAADSCFDPPGDHALAHLQVGDHVKLAAACAHGRVRDCFWVRITQVLQRTETENPLVVGPLDGRPAIMHGEVTEGCTVAPIGRGAVVAFDACNILELA